MSIKSAEYLSIVHSKGMSIKCVEAAALQTVPYITEQIVDANAYIIWLLQSLDFIKQVSLRVPVNLSLFEDTWFCSQISVYNF